MTHNKHASALAHAAQYGQTYRQKTHPLHPSATTSELRQLFNVELPEEPTPGDTVIRQLIAAAEPGLVGNTDPNFYAWVMGGSDPVGVAADWLTSIWGQNAGIFQTSPAAAIAEEAVASWLLEMLDLPRESSVGLVTGATMAGFVGLAAARTAIIARYGHDFEREGLQGVPLVKIYLSDDTHVSNLAALRHLGFGEANIERIASDANGLIEIEALRTAMEGTDGPKIIVATAGHINSGGFDDFEAVARLSQLHNAWLHIDGAFGLWARVLPEKQHLTRGLDLADSWSVDGHKWLQIPYDSGFAIVKDADAHKRAMDISASYLNQAEDDGRNPTLYNPELSRRARGFAAWAVFKALGKSGIRSLVAKHCKSAKLLADEVAKIPGLSVVSAVELNQVIVATSKSYSGCNNAIKSLSEELNKNHSVFVKTAMWKERMVLRLSLISQETDCDHAEKLVQSIRTAWETIQQRQELEGQFTTGTF